MKLSHFLLACSGLLAACGTAVSPTGTETTQTTASASPWQPDCGHISTHAGGGAGAIFMCAVLDDGDSSAVLGAWEGCTPHSVEEHGGSGWAIHSYYWALTNCSEYVPY